MAVDSPELSSPLAGTRAADRT